MKILVIDKYNYKRDLAQMDMYSALSEKYEIIYAKSDNLMDYISDGNYDLLYLGIYHPWCAKPDWNELFKINKKPILIDQADNEGFVARVYNNKFEYKGDYILLSRYLPNKNIDRIWKHRLSLLPWYINPNRFIPQEKTIDTTFVCTINIRRLGNDRKIMSNDILKYCQNNNLSYKIGEYYNNDYSDIITKSKSIIIDGSRYCLTQKYIEGALSNCILIGEKPLFPTNEFITMDLKSINSNNIDELYNNGNVLFNKKYVLDNYANKEKFLSNFNEIISNL